MDVFGMNLAVLIGGVFGGIIGFVIIGFTLAVLILPYIMMYRAKKDNDTPKERRRLADEQRF